MASLSAAELQRRHELEGAPDPFPALGGEEKPQQPKRAGPAPPAQLDTDSTAMFPALAPTAPGKQPVASVWGQDTGPRIKVSAPKSKGITETFTLSVIDLSRAGRDGKASNLGEVMKNTMNRFKVKVEASTQRKTGSTTFFVKGESEREVDKAKRYLIATLSPSVTLTVNVPASTIAAIIGPKGANLKQIRDQTGVRVDIPRRDTLAPNGNGQANGSSTPATRSVTPAPEGDEEEPTVPVTLQGPAPYADEARDQILSIVAAKTAKTTQRVRDIPQNIVEFVISRKGYFEAAAEGEELNLAWNAKDREIAASGDRAAVGRAIERVKATIEEFKTGLQHVKLQLPKRQHRLLEGAGAKEVFNKSKCTVSVPKHEEASEEVVIWGLPADLGSGVQAVMQRANSQYIHEYPLPGPIALSRQMVTYINRSSYPKTLAAEYPGVTVHPPAFVPADKQGSVNVDFVGEKSAVDAAVTKFSELIGKLVGATRDVEIDWLLHRVIQGKNGKKLKQLHDANNVVIYWPPESAESSTVVLVYDPLAANASSLPTEKAKHLDEVEKELKKFAKDAADVKSETLSVDKKWHEAIIGQGGTTLNAIIGEDKALAIKLGADAAKWVSGGATADENTIVVRGASADVDRAKKEILRIVEEAKNDEIVNSYEVEFDIGREYVSKIIGAQGIGVNKLRDALGVKVDFNDEADEKEKEGKKKKAAAAPKSKVKITGRKENVEEAKRRIQAQVERLADETFQILKVPRQYHASIIGQNGKYVTRLEEKYSVKITFPREGGENAEGGKTRENLKSDEVLVKGGKKGVAGAVAEIVDAVEFEKESDHSLSFTIPVRTVARVLGKAGSQINEIKDNTGAQIDIDKANEDQGPKAVANVTVRGTKKAIAAAKEAILAISTSIQDEVTEIIKIESKFHRTLIGAGGKGLRELIVRCGGPEDSRAQAGLIHFPKQDEPADEVRLRGEKTLVAKIKAELEKEAAIQRDRIVLGVVVPAPQHRNLIGRGGQHLNDLQKRTGAQVQFPGSRSYNQVGEPANAEELKDANPADVVKVLGPKAAVEKAIVELKQQIREPTPDLISETIAVSLKYHHVISQQGNFFRNLRVQGVNVDQSAVPSKPAVPTRPTEVPSTRIDDVEGDISGVQWQVISNYQDAEEGDSQWTLKAKDQAALDKAKAAINKAIGHAEKATHVGFLTLPDRSVFPRIVGAKGANAARLRQETGADITVGRDDNLITIIGSEDAVLAAKEAILQIAESKPRGGRY